MSENVNEVDYDVDPEILDDENEGVGDEAAYSFDDGFVEYDPSQFELPEDYEEEDDEEGDENG